MLLEIIGHDGKSRKADIFELGENIISLSNESYKVYNGTSYSCAITTSKYIKKEAKYEK